MTHEETERMYIATCGCCTLAEAMKDCKLCRFNIGLTYKAIGKAAQVIKTAEQNLIPSPIVRAKFLETAHNL